MGTAAIVDEGRFPVTRKLILLAIAATVVIAAALLFMLTEPATEARLPPHTPDLDNGRTMFAVGGCASCHAMPNVNPEKLDRTRLGGGLALRSPFGTFHVPNISPDREDGIGAWSEADFVNALWHGTSPRGAHLYPAFPYASYARMRLADVRDLFAYLKTLPPVAGRAPAHDVAFPFNQRRLIGLWKLMFFHVRPFEPDPARSAILNRGAYLAEGPGHCAECHSPRNLLGAVVAAERFAGGPAPDGKGFVPNITPAGLQHGNDPQIAWSRQDLLAFLDSGVMPDGDFAGAGMAEVIRNTAMLSADDRAAIADYILALPPRQGPKPPRSK
jgi:mono/diheme cytochrome c family protein